MTSTEDSENFIYKINKIIPLLNGLDLENVKEMDYGPSQPAKSKVFGPKVMAKKRYLVLLYIGKWMPFRADGKGKEIDDLVYFSAYGIDKIAKHLVFKPLKIDFDYRHKQQQYLKVRR